MLFRSIPGDLWPINANAKQIHQVLLNLCVNARDAMPRGGKLSLRAENCLLDDQTARRIDRSSSTMKTIGSPSLVGGCDGLTSLVTRLPHGAREW